MARTLKQIGVGVCPCCGQSTPVKEQANGLAMINCQWCETKTQAFSGRGDKLIRAKMAPHAEEKTPEAKPAATPTDNPAPKTEGKKDWF